jgi:DUF1680 family protein
MPVPIVTDTSRSPYARLRPVPLTAVTLDDAFWAPRRRLNREAVLPAQYRLLEDTGRVDNLRRAGGLKTGIPFQGYYYNDSDVYKWLEAVAWTLAEGPAPTLEAMVEEVITVIAAAQRPDGYLDSYFALERAGERWTNLRDLHELYCAGHFLQAAVAHYRATGSERLLAVARRLADHIGTVFGPGPGQRPGTPGHPEVEMALVELARTTGETRYRDLAQFLLDNRGRGLIGGSSYHQDHVPFRDMDRIAGHAVRAVYLNAGAADLYAETGEEALRAALGRLWENMVTRQLYVSGGIGQRHEGEAFGADYELPNGRAYAETCAAIGSIMWNWRMLMLAGDARYADLIETTLYNAVLVGSSLDGQTYFYDNPLASDGEHRRQPWFSCACCPPNVARLLASLPGYCYSLSDEGIWVHLYAAGSARLPLPDGQVVTLHQRTRYPWDGEIELEVAGTGEFSLFLRVPGWCVASPPALEVNGRPFAGEICPGTYVRVRRDWRPGDVVRLALPMPVRRVACHSYVAENAGRVALFRGPLLYCLEGADQPGVELRDVVLPAGVAFQDEFRPELLGGVVVVRAPAEVVPPDEGWAGRLYRPAGEAGAVCGQPLSITAIPYYAWANRDPGPLQVWLVLSS